MRETSLPPDALKEKRIAAYSLRNRILKFNGFSSYAEYLKSDLWRGIRAVILSKSPRCYLCNQRATQVHHNRYTYANLAGRSYKHLVSLCDICHISIEYRDDGLKVSPHGAARQLRVAHKTMPPLWELIYVRDTTCNRCGIPMLWFKSEAGRFFPVNRSTEKLHSPKECRQVRRNEEADSLSKAGSH